MELENVYNTDGNRGYDSAKCMLFCLTHVGIWLYLKLKFDVQLRFWTTSNKRWNKTQGTHVRHKTYLPLIYKEMIKQK